MNTDSPLIFLPGEVAVLAQVDPKTVTRWTKRQGVTCFRTLGGHRRFRLTVVRDQLGIPQTVIDGSDRLMRPSDVAGLFRVDPKTVTRWGVNGKITRVRLISGHTRYLASEITALRESS